MGTKSRQRFLIERQEECMRALQPLFDAKAIILQYSLPSLPSYILSSTGELKEVNYPDKDKLFEQLDEVIAYIRGLYGVT